MGGLELVTVTYFTIRPCGRWTLGASLQPASSRLLAIIAPLSQGGVLCAGRLGCLWWFLARSHHSARPRPQRVRRQGFCASEAMRFVVFVGTANLFRPPSQTRLERHEIKPAPATATAACWPCETTAAPASANIPAWSVFSREYSAPRREPRRSVPATEETARSGNRFPRS